VRVVYESHVREALRLAARGRYRASPNPLVGALVLDRRGRVVGRGYHAFVGGDHAEVAALADAGSRARGGTVVVTLEPCCHHGRTPPCVEALQKAGVARVVACHADPDARVRGRGVALLRRAGIEVQVGVMEREALALNLRFAVSAIEKRAQVTLKWAMSLDGKIATASGESQWISSPAGRRWALDLREQHDAILVGSGTVLADDPSLNRRLGKAKGPIVRVVLDRRLRTPVDARLFSLAEPLVVYTESDDERSRERLEAAGAEVRRRQRWTLLEITRDLRRRGVHSVLVEGGGEMIGAFVAAKLFDRVDVCSAPMLIGGAAAAGPIGGEGVRRLAVAPRLERIRTGRRGPDLVISALREGRLEELSMALRKA
jgi:diaminohydroxyphosphoribosylaminopyrimidine deaminase/5-amino-6-(5-phosphoribosylamino)uracil reductase